MRNILHFIITKLGQMTGVQLPKVVTYRSSEEQRGFFRGAKLGYFRGSGCSRSSGCWGCRRRSSRTVFDAILYQRE